MAQPELPDITELIMNQPPPKSVIQKKRKLAIRKLRTCPSDEGRAKIKSPFFLQSSKHLFRRTKIFVPSDICYQVSDIQD